MTINATRITGTGSAFPSTRITNEDLVKELAAHGVETNNEWIIERTGIKERRRAIQGLDSENNSSLAYQATLKALEASGKKVDDIEFIIYSTCTPDTILPSSSCWLQTKLGAKNAWALDVNAACSGFIYALDMADLYIKTGRYKCGLIIGAEKLSSIVNWKDRSSCILFGDGAGAFIVESTPSQKNDSQIINSRLGSDGNLWEILYVPEGGSNQITTIKTLENSSNKISMKGKDVFKIAVKTLSDYFNQSLELAGLKSEQLDWFIPHQANLRIIEAVAKRVSFPVEKTAINIDRYGNTSSATIPTALDELIRSGKLKRGQTVLLDVFGAGLTYGSLLLRY